MQFICRVGTPDGRVFEEVITASDEASLRTDLGKRGYHLFEAKRRGVARKLAMPAALGLRRRIPDQEFMAFNQELAALIKAGLPLLQALDLMLERMKNLQFRSVLADIRDRVKSGTDLSEAFAAQGDLFPRLYPSSLKAGERSGELELVLRRFIRYMKLVLDARRRVISALIYPAVLVFLSITMIAIMAIYVVPKFMSFFNELGADLPLITQIVLAVSTFASANWLPILVALVVTAVLLRSWARTESGGLTVDRLKIRLPLMGPVLHRFALAEFCRALSTLLAGGIPLVPAFEIAVASVGNSYARSRLEPTIQMVREGKPFYSALGDERDLPRHVDRHGEGRRDDRVARRNAGQRRGLPGRAGRDEDAAPVVPRRADDAGVHGHHHRDPAGLDLSAHVLDARFVEVLALCW